MAARPTEPIRCPICRNRYRPAEMSRHHLVPKSRRGRETVWLCRHCHRQIHALFTEKELERRYDTIDKLLAADEMQSWIRWIRRHKPRSRIRAVTSRRKRG